MFSSPDFGDLDPTHRCCGSALWNHGRKRVCLCGFFRADVAFTFCSFFAIYYVQYYSRLLSPVQPPISGDFSRKNFIVLCFPSLQSGGFSREKLGNFPFFRSPLPGSGPAPPARRALFGLPVVFFVKKLTLQFEGRYGMVFVRKCPPGVGVSEKSVIFLHLFPFYRKKTRSEPYQSSPFSVTKLVNFRKKTLFPLYNK